MSDLRRSSVNDQSILKPVTLSTSAYIASSVRTWFDFIFFLVFVFFVSTGQACAAVRCSAHVDVADALVVVGPPQSSSSRNQVS